LGWKLLLFPLQILQHHAIWLEDSMFLSTEGF
jgi:hypothetical protein